MTCRLAGFYEMAKTLSHGDHSLMFAYCSYFPLDAKLVACFDVLKKKRFFLH
jgi:hypothetical protein